MLEWRRGLGVLPVLESEDHIAELSKRAVAEKDPAAVKEILAELRAALTEFTHTARRMTLLHFDYFQKHDEPSPGAKPKRNEDVRKKLRE
jgi:hypothetical protein